MTDLDSLKSDIDKLDNDKIAKLPSSLNRLTSNVNKLDVDQVKPVPTNLKKLTDVVNKTLLKRCVSWTG